MMMAVVVGATLLFGKPAFHVCNLAVRSEKAQKGSRIREPGRSITTRLNCRSP
nr:hypothetical protein [Paraburkholderia sp. CNPSo 3272]